MNQAHLTKELLEKTLHLFSINTSRWGLNGYKTLDSLFTEIQDEESTLVVRPCGLVRELNTVIMVIEGKHGILTEDYQILQNGCKIERGFQPGGKMRVNEIYEEALKREIYEELKLDPREYKYKLCHKQSVLRDSPSFPTLQTLNHEHYVDIELLEAARKKIIDGYSVEDKDGKILFFKWESKRSYKAPR